MGKILSGIMGIVLVASVVGGTAFAVFTSNVTVSGVTLTTGNAALKINGQSSLPATALFTGGVYPGWMEGQPFTLSNESTSPISLSTAARITATSGAWGDLNTIISVAVVEYYDINGVNAAILAHDPGLGAIANTGWKTLSEWNNATPIPVGTNIAQTKTHDYVIWGMVPTTADDTIANKNVVTDWLITGTQVTP